MKIIPPSRKMFGSDVGRWALVMTVVYLLGVGLSSTSAFRRFAWQLEDSYFRLQHDKSGSNQIVLVLIDDKSLEKFGRWPWSRSELADLVRKISSKKPQVIGLDLLLSEKQSEEADSQLANAIHEAGNVVLVDKLSSSPDSASLWVEPIPELQNAAAAVGHAQALLDADGVCRRFQAAEMSLDGVREAFALEIARRSSAAAVKRFMDRVSPNCAIPEDGVLRPLALRIPYGPARRGQTSRFPTLSASDLLEGNAFLPLHGKVVLVGFGASELQDRLVTPLGGLQPTPGVEINAEILDAILSGRSLREAPAFSRLLLLLLLCGVAAAVSLRLRPMKAAVATLILCAAIYGCAVLMFLAQGTLIGVGPILFCAALALPVTQLERLISIDRQIGRQLLLIESTMERSARFASGCPQIAQLPDTSTPDWKLGTLERLQSQLVEQHEFSQALLDSTRDGIVVFDNQGSLLFGNSVFTSMWDSAGMTSSPSCAALVGLLRDRGCGSASDGLRDLEDEVLIADRLWSIRATPIATGADDFKPLMIVFTDLQTRMERDQARAESLGFVTHELRTPLVAIQGFAELMMRSPGAHQASAQIIFRESRRLVSLINSYLDVLRLDSGARQLTTAPIEASVVTRQVITTLQPLADAKRIVLTENVASDLIVECDSTLIVGAVMNLVSNAIKYGETGSTVKLAGSARDGTVRFSVWNSGTHIPEGEVPRLFEPFFRGRSERGAQTGWGLGLALVKRIVSKHKGQVMVRNHAGEGVEFVIAIPCSVEQLSPKESRA